MYKQKKGRIVFVITFIIVVLVIGVAQIYQSSFQKNEKNTKQTNEQQNNKTKEKERDEMLINNNSKLINTDIEAMANPTPEHISNIIYIVDQNHKNATDEGNGTTDQPFKTISKAASIALPGDTIVAHEGIYRERVAPANGGLPGHPIVYMAAEGEKVYVKGSDVWKNNWNLVDGKKNIYTGKIDESLFGTYNPYKIKFSVFELLAGTDYYAQYGEELSGNMLNVKTPAAEKYTLGQLFVDGKIFKEMLNRAEVDATECSWVYLEDDESIYVHFPVSFDKEASLVELTTRMRIFAPHKRGLGYITVKGFIFEHCANNAPFYPFMGATPEQATGQMGAVSTRSGHHWNIENNIIRFTKTVGLDIGSEAPKGGEDYEEIMYETPPQEAVGYHVIKNNYISDNGIAGILGTTLNNVKILYNIVERNNLLLSTGKQHAGIKILVTEGCLIEGNIVKDNQCKGIWIDNNVNNSIVRNNVLINNQGQGLFVELTPGPVLVENNIIASTRPAIDIVDSSGLRITDSNKVSVFNNLIFNNARYGIQVGLGPDRKAVPKTVTKSGLTECNELMIANNIILNNIEGYIALPYPGKRSSGIICDNNVFAGPGMFDIHAQAEDNGPNRNGFFKQASSIVNLYNTISGSKISVDNKEARRYSWCLPIQLKWWQKMMKCDENSIVVSPEEAQALIEKEDMLTLQVSEQVAKMNGMKTDTVKTDFYGNILIPEMGIRPGPFQDIKPGINIYKLSKDERSFHGE